MRFILKLLCISVIICPVLIHAAEISEDLQAQMNLTKPDQLIQVWIEFPKVVEGKKIAATHAQNIKSKTERNKSIVESFKEEHANSQNDVLRILKELPNSDQKKIKSHWLVNLIETELTVSEINQLGNRNDIKAIYTVPQVTTIEPEEIKFNNSQYASVGVESNLSYINAPAAWAAGYTGVGSVVCSFDTGVNGEHGALNHSWKGKDGDSLAAWFDPTKKLLAPHLIPDCGCNVTHGTHTMGIMVGVDNITGDTVGVAPGAKWISAAVIDIPGASIVDGFEWAVDPDGNPNTSDDVPDVINHSWGIPDVDCQNLFYDLIDNIEVLGIVNIFSAGNDGSSTSSIRNPADRANDSLDCFAVGNINHTLESVPSTSSRGPSLCPFGEIKPNVAAPGEAIRSSTTTSNYGFLSGTSMSAPHVSGLVALLRQKNPNATVDEIKLAILNSTQNMGQSVPNNDIGWGVIDCMAALNELSDVNAVPNISLYAFDHDPIAAGDTVVGTIVLENKGADDGSVVATIVGTNQALQVISGSSTFGDIFEGDTVRSASTFEVIVSDTVSSGTFLPIDLEISGDETLDTVKLYFLVEPKTSRSFITHDVGNIQFTISNFGTYGLESSFFPTTGAEGFRYNTGLDTLDIFGDNDLFEGGLVIGLSSSAISDGIRNSGGEPDGDFAVLPGGDIMLVSPKLGVSQQSFSRFSDSRAENPIGLEIEQQTFAFDYAPYKDFIILEYIITNRSGGNLNDLYVGIYLDWDIYNWNSNSGGYELGNQFSWVAYNLANIYSYHRGIKVLDPSTDGSYTEYGDSAYYWSAQYPENDGFTELEKFNALANGFTNSEFFKTIATDIIQVSSAKISLSNNQTDTVSFALLAGDGFVDIQTAAAQASIAYSGVVTDIDDINGPDELPQTFSLNQNYPNPFNPSTTISFELPKKSEYRFEIFNLMGQKLVEKTETADAGKHSIEWDASGYASGIYLYKLTVDSFTESKKMVLLK